MSKQYEITVKILVSVPDDGSLGMTADQWGNKIACDYAKMAINYRNIGAEKLLEVIYKEVENV